EKKLLVHAALRQGCGGYGRTLPCKDTIDPGGVGARGGEHRWSAGCAGREGDPAPGAPEPGCAGGDLARAPSHGRNEDPGANRDRGLDDAVRFPETAFASPDL